MRKQILGDMTTSPVTATLTNGDLHVHGCYPRPFTVKVCTLNRTLFEQTYPGDKFVDETHPIDAEEPCCILSVKEAEPVRRRAEDDPGAVRLVQIGSELIGLDLTSDEPSE